MCHTAVTSEGETLEMWLTVMDGKNQAMKKQPYYDQTIYGEKQVAQATMFDINKTIMRCLVKNLAMFGMGIYIYSGDDLPEADVEEVVTKPKATTKKPTPKTVSKETLDTDSPRWQGLMKFAQENKQIGYKKLVDKLELAGNCRLSAKAKNEIKNLV